MLPDTGDRTPYLQLALDARKVINALLRFMQTEDDVDPELLGSIQDASCSLRAISDRTSLFAHLQGRSAFEHYEQIQILGEVRETLKDDRLIEKLNAIIDRNVDAAARRRHAGNVVAFFSALESRALHHYKKAPVHTFA